MKCAMHTRLLSLTLALVLFMLSLSSCGSLFGDDEPLPEEDLVPYRDQYLINLCEPTESHYYEAYPHTSTTTSKPLYMAGYPYYGGFKLTTPGLIGEENASYAVFDIRPYAGKTLSFVMGSAAYDGYEDNNYYALVSVQLDGEQVVDELIRAHDVPKRYTLDLTGKSELKFLIKEGSNDVSVAELMVWDGDVAITGHTPDTSKNRVQLIKDLLPYMWKYNRMGDNNTIYTADQLDAGMEKFGAVFANLDDFDRNESFKNQEVLIGGKSYAEVFTSRVTMQIVGTDVNTYHFNTEGLYQYLSFSLGTRNTENEKEGVSWVSVYADGERVFEEQVFSDALPKKYTVDIRRASMIEFEFKHYEGGSHVVAVFDAFLGKTLADVGSDAVSDVDVYPDVCKLISTIPPYSVASGEEKPVYDGSSEHKTFTMAGRKYNEGIILYSEANIMYGNSGAHACFNLEGKFRYLTFKAGILDKSHCVVDDILEIYLDGELTQTIELHAMDLPYEYTIELNGCQEIKFKLVGRGTMVRPAYGIADIVVYKNEVTEHDLFPEEINNYPDRMPLIENIPPYMSYSALAEESEDILYDGSTKQHYFEINGEKKYSGVMLQTSVHLDLLGMGGGMSAEGVYAALVAIPFVGGFLAILAADTRYENSFSAFDLRGEFRTVTFTVACGDPDWYITGMEEETVLKIGSNVEDVIMETITLSRTMEPTTYTVPIENAEQLIFFLECGDSTSAPYAIYDIVVEKK